MRLASWIFLAFLWSRFESIGWAMDAALVYQQKCSNCHGADGQGVSGVYESALAGPRSIGELARLIERTMPEGESEKCVGQEAEQVADYIFHEFYSPAARIRKGLESAASVEPARLTVAQYRNAVADIIASFSPPGPSTRMLSPIALTVSPPGRNPEDDTEVPVQLGLKGLYYGSKGMSKAETLVTNRIDPCIDFDFGQTAPYEGMPDDQFAIVWQGALFAPESGEYQLRVSTPNGARVYLNLDPDKGLHKLRDDSGAAGQDPLIDSWVGSGQLREESAQVELLGGRLYPLRVEFFKYQDSSASIRLDWKPPNGAWAILDKRNLTTAEVGRTFVPDSAFPPDDHSAGFERGTSITPQWYAAIAESAVAAAEEVVSRLPLLAGTSQELSEEECRQKTRDWIAQFARVAFRRPLDEQQMDQIRRTIVSDQESLEEATASAITWILSSPDFLIADMIPAGQSPSQHAVASRLALCLWDSIPDTELLLAAESGQLGTSEQVGAQASRMLNDLRTRHKLNGFFRHWLHLEERDLTKDKTLFAEFNSSVFADLKYSLELFLESTVWGASDYRQLLSSQEVWLSPPLQALYGKLPDEQATDGTKKKDPSTDFSRVIIADQPTAGVLTHPYLLAALAYHNNTSPIHRGVLVARNLLGRTLRPPPVAIAFENEDFPPELTMRQKVSHLTQDASCLSCHTIINPLGFSLENYDAVGRWRDHENGSPIDSASDYETEDGEVVSLASPRDVAELAVRSTAAHRAFVLQVFQHLTKQFPAAYGPEVLADLVEQFEKDDFHIQNLIVRIAVLASRQGCQNAIQVEYPARQMDDLEKK